MKISLKKMAPLAIVIVLLAVVVVSCFANPLRRPEETIRDRLLLQMPLGSSEDEVVAFISRNEGWRLSEHVTNLVPGNDLFRYPPEHPPGRTRRVHMGIYHTPFRTYVTAFWRFSDDDELFELIIRKCASLP